MNEQLIQTVRDRAQNDASIAGFRSFRHNCLTSLITSSRDSTADKLSCPNLALCCGRCNQHKGPNIAGIDPSTGQLTPLFNPRSQDWTGHFEYDGPLLVGKSSEARTTIVVLAINLPIRVEVREWLIRANLF